MSFSASALLSLSLGLMANAHPAAPSTPCNQPYDMPLIRDQNYGFMANISFGTPPQTITSFVDWTWTSQYVVSTTCNGSQDNTAACLHPAQQLYNQSLSSTYKSEKATHPSESWYPNEFFPAPFNVDYASDVQTIGPVKSRILLQTSNIQPGIFTAFPLPFGGIYGMMPDPPSDDANDISPFNQQYKAKAWPQPYSAFAFCPNPSCPPGADAIQTIGGYSPALARKGLTWYNIVEVPEVNEIDFTFAPGVYSYWSIGLTGLYIGDEKQALNTTAINTNEGVPAAIFDHASKGRGLPLSTDAYARLVKLAGGQPIAPNSPLLTPNAPNNGKQPFFSVNCKKAYALPTISYIFAGSRKPWTVSSSVYVKQVSGTCILNVRTIGEGSFLLGNFGEDFLTGKYVVFDYAKQRVGLAEV